MSADRDSKAQGVQLAVMEGLDHKGIQGKMVTWYALNNCLSVQLYKSI